MKIYKEKDMIRGWFVGDFLPTVYRTESCEVSFRRYKAGDHEDFHHHKIATEITLIASGEVEMNGVKYREGDIIVIEPGEGTDFSALTDATNVVVKIPGAKNDKYLGRSADN